MDTRIKQIKLIKSILEITNSDVLDELDKSLGKILFQDRMDSQGEAKITISGRTSMSNEEAIRLLEIEDENNSEIVQEEDEYRNKLVDAVKNLSDCRGEIFTSLINVAMLGEFKDIHETFEVGDTFEFEIEQFRDSKDINVEKMVQLYEFMSETMESIMNLNSIENPEDLN